MRAAPEGLAMIEGGKSGPSGKLRTVVGVGAGVAWAVLLLMGLYTGAGWAVGRGAAAAAPAMVTIRTFAFQPQTITVPAGSTVVWTNEDDAPHTVTSTDHRLNSPGLDQGERFTATFAEPGTYSYFCSLHPHMRGVVVVR